MDVAIERARSALFLVFTADALSMPVHWFYNPAAIPEAFPATKGIAKMEAAPRYHPSSIMNLHSTKQGGRTAAGLAGKQAQEIVGDVILKGKRQFWGQRGVHYHQGLPAGENTLNAYCARLMLKFLNPSSAPSSTTSSEEDRTSLPFQYTTAGWLHRYIEFMTAETPQHPDTYAESYHRGFFANLVAGKEPERCAQVTHDTPSVGGLVTVAPLAIIHLLQQAQPPTGDEKQMPVLSAEALKRVQATARGHLALTHPDKKLFQVCDEYVNLMAQLLFRPSVSAAAPHGAQHPKTILREVAKKHIVGWSISESKLDTLIDQLPKDNSEASRRVESNVVGGPFSTACYITDSWPNLLYLATRYWDAPEQGMLANTNLGGENCHRGSVLGSLLGLAGEGGGHQLPLTMQLKHYDEIAKEIDAVLKQSTSTADRTCLKSDL